MANEHAIRLMQQAMNRLHGIPCDEDGIWGNESSKAFKKYVASLDKPEVADEKQVDVIKNRIRSVINIFETGSAETNYHSLFAYNDGPDRRKQLTIGWGITESGNMKALVQKYLDLGGRYTDLEVYLPYIGNFKEGTLARDSNFKKLISEASKEDPKMKEASDYIYDIKYWNRAVDWYSKHGFTKSLSLLVIMDSFVHSGSMMGWLLNRFPEAKPARGGDEKEYIKQYCNTRRSWLKGHSNKILRNTIYRCDFFLKEIREKNWNLDLPLSNVHGKDIIT